MSEYKVRLRNGSPARVYDPQQNGRPAAKVGVVVLHPWAALGGSMHDPHVVTVVRFFSECGCATARLNFRTGFSCGSTPVEDVRDAAATLLETGVSRILVVGYSYGAIVAMAASAAMPESLGWCAINAPLDYAWALFLFNGGRLLHEAREAKPKLLIHASSDVFCATATFEAFYSTLPEPKTALRVADASHFNVVCQIAPALTDWLKLHFGASPERLASGDFELFREA
ncbi:Alpha/Beta hydrolase protein [Pelagophyceae sp. CCMP2097]|nr:Alpha/Beta hydrolase protein [Pelagophyceae sp. CCMP2097]